MLTETSQLLHDERRNARGGSNDGLHLGGLAVKPLDLERVKKVFDERSMYDAVVDAGYMYHARLAAWLAAWAQEQPQPLAVVDLGCGDGWLAAHAFGAADVQKYVGVDGSEASVELARARLASWGDRAEVITGELAAALRAMPAESVNVVLASYSIHHFSPDGKRAVLADCRRVLASGGTLIWIDVYRRPDETRDATVGRLTGAIERNWTALTGDERTRACDHIRESDFPETLPWMLDAARDAGFEYAGMFLEAEFFAGLRFTRPPAGR